jgi:hypothetical protein
MSSAGVFRFQDGSLLMVSLTQGSDCLQFTSTAQPYLKPR